MEFRSLLVLRKNRFILMFDSFDTSAAWNPDQLKEKKDWIFEINKEASDYIAENIKKVFEPKKDLFDYSRDEFDLGPILENVSNAAKKAYYGYGLSLIKGLPRNTLNNQEFKLLIWAIGLHLGVARPQGMFSQYISEVKATGMNYRSDAGRGYNSNAKLDFHTDGCDLVGLACYNKAMEGGQSLIASSVTAWQLLLSERPDLAEVALENFYFSHNEEQIPGECPYYVQPLFDFAKGHLFGKWNWNRVRTAQKMDDIPKLSLIQLECINFLEEILRRPDVLFTSWFEPGDLQFINNHVILHSRTGFKDFEEIERKRLLIRIWIAPPYSLRLPDSWKDFWKSIDPGSVRGGIYGKNYDNKCRLFEKRQSELMGMTLPSSLST